FNCSSDFCTCCSFVVYVVALINSLFFFFDVSPTTVIYSLSLHDALPIFRFPLATVALLLGAGAGCNQRAQRFCEVSAPAAFEERSEEHTSELQSRENLVCRLLLEKKKPLRHRH